MATVPLTFASGAPVGTVIGTINADPSALVSISAQSTPNALQVANVRGVWQLQVGSGALTGNNTYTYSLMETTSGSVNETTAPSGGTMLPFLLATDFGVKADGVTDDTAALQAAINASVNQTLALPAGTMLVSAALNFGSTVDTSYNLIGQGGGETGKTRFIWNGNATSPMFSLNGIRDSSFKNFALAANASKPLMAGFLSQTIAGTIPTNNKFESIWMNGTTTGLGKGWMFAAGTGGDNNNDLNIFTDCTVLAFATAAWSFEHAESQAHNFYGCKFIGGAGQTAQYGITTALGSGNRGGYFSWYGGASGGVAEADFYLGSPNGPVLISGGVFENSPRFLEMPGSSASGWAVKVDGCRISGNNLNADGKIIIFQDRGPLILEGNHIGDSVGGGTTALQIFAKQSSGTPGQAPAVAIGNNIWSSLANPFTGDFAWNLIGNGLGNAPGATPVPGTNVL